MIWEEKTKDPIPLDGPKVIRLLRLAVPHPRPAHPWTHSPKNPAFQGPQFSLWPAGVAPELLLVPYQCVSGSHLRLGTLQNFRFQRVPEPAASEGLL